MAIKRRKISIIGGGYTGATIAFMLTQKELGDICILDIPEKEDPIRGKALDIMQSTPVSGVDSKVIGTTHYEDTKNSDIVIITAGISRRPGMTRDDLVSTNASVMKVVTKQVVEQSPNCYIIVLTNPVDAMTYTVYKESGLPKNKVMGQSGILDTARFRSFVAEELNISVEDITGFVLGGHGDEMVPLLRYSHAGGIPLDKLIPNDRLEQIVERTRKGGGEIVNLLGNGSSYFAPSIAVIQMVEAILKDKRRVIPTIAYLEGEYGYHDLYLGVPTIIGGNGVEQVINLDLTLEERKALDLSVDSVRSVMRLL